MREMVKVKLERTADCVVAGFRRVADVEPAVASLLLGLYDGDVLRHVGVVASFTEKRRGELYRDLAPLATSLAGHPWARGFNIGQSPMGRLGGAAGRWDPSMTLDWVPVRIERVADNTERRIRTIVNTLRQRRTTFCRQTPSAAGQAPSPVPQGRGHHPGK